MAFFFCTAQPAGAIEKFEVKVGNELTYHVKNKGKEYDFIITVKDLNALNENAIVFDWQMTAPVNKKGTITISHDAGLALRVVRRCGDAGSRPLSHPAVAKTEGCRGRNGILGARRSDALDQKFHRARNQQGGDDDGARRDILDSQ